MVFQIEHLMLVGSLQGSARPVLAEQSASERLEFGSDANSWENNQCPASMSDPGA